MCSGQIWFNNELLHELLNSPREMLGFICVELYLCIYHCSPEEFYDPTLVAKATHPAAEKCIPHKGVQGNLPGFVKEVKDY